MKFRMNFGWWKTLLITLVVVLGVAIAIIDFILLTGATSLKTASPAVAGVSLAAGLIITVAACLLLFNSFYKFKDGELKITLGFFADKIDARLINTVMENSVTHELFLICDGASDTDEDVKIRLNLSPKQNEKFLAEIKENNPFAIIQLFNPPEKKTKKK